MIALEKIMSEYSFNIDKIIETVASKLAIDIAYFENIRQIFENYLAFRRNLLLKFI